MEALEEFDLVLEPLEAVEDEVVDDEDDDFSTDDVELPLAMASPMTPLLLFLISLFFRFAIFLGERAVGRDVQE